MADACTCETGEKKDMVQAAIEEIWEKCIHSVKGFYLNIEEKHDGYTTCF
jgi:hypothetical protein